MMASANISPADGPPTFSRLMVTVNGARQVLPTATPRRAPFPSFGGGPTFTLSDSGFARPLPTPSVGGGPPFTLSDGALPCRFTTTGTVVPGVSDWTIAVSSWLVSADRP